MHGEEAEHASKFAELLGDMVWDTKTNLEKRMHAEAGANADKMRIAKNAKAQNLDAIHDTVHEMAKTKPATVAASKVFTTAISANNHPFKTIQERTESYFFALSSF